VISDWSIVLKRIFLFISIAAIYATLSVRAGSPQRTSLADLPDPLVGTDSSYELSRGNTYPAVFLPFGMIAWTAQTGEGGWPYQYSKDRIRGFLATHRPSAWTDDYGPFSLMPLTGTLKVLPDERGSHFQHSNEDARAYRYSVTLDDYHVRAEMTPAPHGGVMRFTYPRTEDAYVVLDAQAGGSTVQLHLEDNTITGTNSSIAGSFPPGFAQYFVAVFDHKFTRQGTWDETGVQADAASREGKHVGAYVGFSTTADEAVTVRIGVSLISLEQARRNLAADMPDGDFDRAVSSARAVWESELGKIELKGGTEAERKTFYTALYHAFELPRALHETGPDGTAIHYSAFDGKVHAGAMYADTGFWDTFRAEFPLLALMQPKRDAEIIRSLLNAYDEGGWMPKWPNPGYTNIMIGTHADSVVADAYMKGIRDYDVEKAYAALRKDATLPGTGRYEARGGIEDYLKLGYVPADGKAKESAASTLEYAYDDFCVSQMARALGKTDDYRLFKEHSTNYKNIFDPKTGFMRGRNRDGSWVEPFDPLAWGGVFTEGNAWQWLWSVQHDVAGLIDLLGGREAFLQKLDTLFSSTTEFHVGGYGKVIHEMTEAKLANTGQYAHINEPVHHVIYLYDYAGQPWKTQQWTRAILDRFYRPGPAGWLGDEDTGQMSSWYIFSSLGFYPVNPGQPVYALTSPVFDHASIHLENGRTFMVESMKRASGDIYVQSARLNGKRLERCWITHDEILKGGILSFRLGPKPNPRWGAGGIPAAN
jgi:predicted alpha-1,2-mannosidase